MNTLISLAAGALPAGYCPTTWQDLLNTFVQNMAANFQGSVANSFYNYGDTAPSPDNNGFPWLRIKTTDQTLNGWYVYASGYWCRAHPYAPSGDVRIIWRGTPNDLWAFDGGDGNDPATTPPGDYVGAMWEVDTDFAGRSPMGAGTVPGTAAPKVLALDEAYGAGEKLLTTNDMPEHHHTVTAEPSCDINKPGARTLFGTAGLAGEFGSSADTSDVGDGSTPLNLVHPVLGVYLAKRTARKYFVVS